MELLFSRVEACRWTTGEQAVAAGRQHLCSFFTPSCSCRFSQPFNSCLSHDVAGLLEDEVDLKSHHCCWVKVLGGDASECMYHHHQVRQQALNTVKSR
jgi:hypothetical protein